MTDQEALVEALRQASETKLHSQPILAVHQAVTRLLPSRADSLMVDVRKLFEMYQVKTFDDLGRVYAAQVRAMVANAKPKKKEKADETAQGSDLQG